MCQCECQRPLGSRAFPYCCSWTQLFSSLWRESGSSCAFLVSCWSIGDHSMILRAPRKAGVVVMKTLWFLSFACTWPAVGMLGCRTEKGETESWIFFSAAVVWDCLYFIIIFCCWSNFLKRQVSVVLILKKSGLF